MLSKFASPSTTLMLVDSWNGNYNGYAYETNAYNAAPGQNEPIDFRHPHSSCNQLFIDGHTLPARLPDIPFGDGYATYWCGE